MHCIAHIDGGSRGNPGPAGVGVLIQQSDGRTETSGPTLLEAGYFLGETTNNVAEYTGLLRCLDAAAGLGATELSIFSDSELMVNQVRGRYRVKAEGLRPLYAQAVQKLAGLERWTITHVRREKNQRADELANMAMDARTDIEVRGKK